MILGCRSCEFDVTLQIWHKARGTEQCRRSAADPKSRFVNSSSSSWMRSVFERRICFLWPWEHHLPRGFYLADESMNVTYEPGLLAEDRQSASQWRYKCMAAAVVLALCDVQQNQKAGVTVFATTPSTWKPFFCCFLSQWNSSGVGKLFLWSKNKAGGQFMLFFSLILGIVSHRQIPVL